MLVKAGGAPLGTGWMSGCPGLASQHLGGVWCGGEFVESECGSGEVLVPRVALQQLGIWPRILLGPLILRAHENVL